MENDLISRSALLKALDELYMAALRKNAHSVETVYELDHLAMLVKDAPHVDAEPVRHARWIPAELHKSFGVIFGVKCSLCGDEKVTRYNYCPNCGAKMMVNRDV